MKSQRSLVVFARSYTVWNMSGAGDGDTGVVLAQWARSRCVGPRPWCAGPPNTNDMKTVAGGNEEAIAAVQLTGIEEAYHAVA